MKARNEVDVSLLQLLQDGKVEEFNGRRGQRVTLDFFAVDLSGAKLPGVDLSGANLEKADLSGADLRGAILAKANLSGADLTGAKLDKCVAVKARFKEAYLGDARAVDGEFSGADFSGADLTAFVAPKARFTGSRFKEAVACRADLTGADLSEARLVEVDLKGAKLGGANLAGAELARADLAGADLTGANLKGGILGGTKLVGCKLDRANLAEADLSGADLTDATVEGADFTKADLFDVVAGADILARIKGPPEPPLMAEPVMVSSSIHVDQPVVARIGAHFAAIWDNTPDDEEEEAAICVGIIAPGESLARIQNLPIASEQVLARAVVPIEGAAFQVLVVVDNPGGVLLQVQDMDVEGRMGEARGVRLGYTPVVRPVFIPDGDGFLIFGIGRQGALSVHRHDATGLKELMRAPAGTYRGFCGHQDPILLGKGGTLAAVRADGIGRLVSAPPGYPGRLTAAAWQDETERIGVAWANRDERGFRYQILGLDPEPVRMEAKREIGALELLCFGDRWLLIWTREADRAGEATQPIGCWVPGGKPFPLLPPGIREEITDIRPVYATETLLALVTFAETLLIVQVGEEGTTMLGKIP